MQARWRASRRKASKRCLSPGQAPVYSARVAIHVPARAIGTHAAASQGPLTVSQATNALKARVSNAARFALREIARRSRQSRIAGPQRGWLSTRASHSGLLRAKQKVASNRKGTV